MKPTLRHKVANALSFAHLAGLSARAKAESDEDPDKKDPDAEDDNPDHQDQDRQDGNSKKSKRANSDDPDKDEPDAEGDDPDKKDPDEDDPDAEDDDKDKKAKADAGDDEDDDDSEMRGKSSAANARRRERARCAAIFGCKEAARNPELAANLAFNTSMTRSEAVVVLRGTATSRSPAGNRGHRNPSLGGGGGGTEGMSSQKAAESRMDAAMKRVRTR